MLKQIRLTMAIIFSVFILFGCSEDEIIGTGGTGIEGLQLPRSINFTSANIDTQNSNALADTVIAAVGESNTDYSTDPIAHATDAINNLALYDTNYFLCLIDEFDATEKVNDGSYKVTFQANICIEGGNDPQNATQVEITMLSKRQDNQSPHFIQIWGTDNIQTELFVGEFIITAGISDETPYGVFEFNYQTLIDDTTQVELTVVRSSSTRSSIGSNQLPRLESRATNETPTTDTISDRASIVAILDTTGSGQSRDLINVETIGTPVEVETLTDFNANYTLTSVNSDSTINSENAGCYSRNEYTESVWWYSLYFNQDSVFNDQAVTAGQRVQLDTNTNPLQFIYTHDAVNNRVNSDPATNLVNNQQYNLNYYQSETWGFIFYRTIDGTIAIDDEVNLKDGTILSNSYGEFITKARGIVHKLLKVNLDDCVGLDSEAVINNADIDPRNVAPTTSPSVGIADWPQI